MKEVFKWGLLAISCFIILCILVVKLMPSKKSEVIVANNSNEVVRRVSVDLCGERKVLTNLQINKQEVFELKVQHDCHFVIEVEFVNNSTFSEKVGYVTHGLNYRHEIGITERKINLKTQVLE